jgi:precorrin-6B methylase 1
LFEFGIIYMIKIHENRAITPAEIMYGRRKRLKLTPEACKATISVCEANFDVKNITAIKTNKELKRLAK